MDIKNIGVDLKTLREDYNLTQIEMAKKIGINSCNYSKVENGTRSMSTTNLIKVCETFGITFEYLLTNPDINFHKSKYITSKERINELTYFQLKYLTEDNCRVIYELAIILDNKQYTKEY